MKQEKYEDVLADTILIELEKERFHYYRPHTEAVVHYIKQIISESSNLNLDKDVLIIAAYAHDWGYVGLFKTEIPQLDDVKKVKDLHMQIGAEKLKLLLEKPVFDFLTSEQKNKAIHLVRFHDKLDLLKDVDEIVLMEADTLGGLDVNRVEPTFGKDSALKYRLIAINKRYGKFITNIGKREFIRLVRQHEEYYK